MYDDIWKHMKVHGMQRLNSTTLQGMASILAATAQKASGQEMTAYAICGLTVKLCKKDASKLRNQIASACV